MVNLVDGIKGYELFHSEKGEVKSSDIVLSLAKELGININYPEYIASSELEEKDILDLNKEIEITDPENESPSYCFNK